MSDTQLASSKRHLLTVLLEDYFHVGAFNRIIQRGQWYRFETRFEQNTLKALDLLDRFDIKATFFVLGWIADRQPELVREVARRGHEIASRGYYHRSIQQMTPTEFREDLARTRDALERASETKVIGYRSAQRWSSSADLWALDILANEGYAYDSSIMPDFRTSRADAWRRFAHLHRYGEKEIWEFPFSTASIGGLQVPIAGGNYFRQFPHTMVKRAVEHWDRTFDAPFVMYFHVWELDPDQPRLSAASPLMRIRHYRKLDKMSWVLEDYFKKYRFVSGAEYLGINTTKEVAPASMETREVVAEIQGSVETALIGSKKIEAGLQKFEIQAPLETLTDDATEQVETDIGPMNRAPISIVIPCYNEELILPYLSNTLKSVEATLSEYDLRFIFVDDSSRDATWETLQQLFGANPKCSFLRHTENRGVAAAILNGIRHARTEIVCSIDCDCTYDPHELRNMIPRLTEDVDLVTASPYHPEGEVRNVPSWRLSLSKTASFLYRQVLRQRLYTYTSCFRVYRRSVVAEIKPREGGFLGVAEMLGRLDLGGSKIVEYPATLEVRLFGRSKMKVSRTIAGHLGLLLRLLAMRVRRTDKHEDATRKEEFTPDPALKSNYQAPTITHQK